MLRGGKLAIVPVEVLQRTDEFAYVAGEGLGDRRAVVIPATCARRSTVCRVRTESEQRVAATARHFRYS